MVSGKLTPAVSGKKRAKTLAKRAPIPSNRNGSLSSITFEYTICGAKKFEIWNLNSEVAIY